VLYTGVVPVVAMPALQSSNKCTRLTTSYRRTPLPEPSIGVRVPPFLGTAVLPVRSAAGRVSSRANLISSWAPDPCLALSDTDEAVVDGCPVTC
jgi:hypothetical protein